MRTIRIGTSGWSYPSGKGTWNGIFYPPQGTARARARRSSTSSRSTPSTSTRSRSTPRFYGVPTAGRRRRMGGAHAAGLRVLAEALSEVHASRDVPQGDRRRSVQPRHEGRRRVPRARSIRSPPPASSARCWRSFPPASRTSQTRAATWSGCSRQFKDYRVAVELRHRSWSDDPRRAPSRCSRRFDAAWTQIDEPKFKFVDPPEPAAERPRRSTTCGCTAATRRSGGSTRSRRTATTICIRPRSSSRSQKRLKARRAQVKKAYLYANNHFSAKSVANAAILKHQLGQPLPGEYPEEFVERYPDLKGLVKMLPPTSLIPSRKPS